MKCYHCDHYDKHTNVCDVDRCQVICPWSDSECDYLKEDQKPTNGDKIRQGGNEALVEYRQKFICHLCAYRFDKKCNGARCKDGLIEWLEQEAKDE